MLSLFDWKHFVVLYSTVWRWFLSYAIIRQRLPVKTRSRCVLNVAGDERVVIAQESTDAAAAAVRPEQPVSEVAMDVQVRLHVQLGQAE